MKDEISQSNIEIKHNTIHIINIERYKHQIQYIMKDIDHNPTQNQQSNIDSRRAACRPAPRAASRCATR